jgi:hypothetical protein
MRVQIVENWSDITGSVHSCNPSEAVAGFTEVIVAVERVSPVAEFPNLLTDRAGGRLTVLMPGELVLSLGVAPRKRLSCRVRRAGRDRVFVHREHVAVFPPRLPEN